MLPHLGVGSVSFSDKTPVSYARYKVQLAAERLAGDGCSAGASSCNSERLIAISRVGDAK